MAHQRHTGNPRKLKRRRRHTCQCRRKLQASQQVSNAITASAQAKKQGAARRVSDVKQAAVQPAKEQAPVSPSTYTEPIRLSLHESDPITGNEDLLSTLFYECYRGYTIYSTWQGTCCLHGVQGCLRLEGYYVSFPDIEEAKKLIKYFRAQGLLSWQSMQRSLPESVYVCLDGKEREQRQMFASCPVLQPVS